MAEPTVKFEWSTKKAISNLKKHGVSFDEAETVFDDDRAYIQGDELHSDEETREVIIGYSAHNRLLVVSLIERVHDRIRIISARAATPREQSIYEETPRF